ELVGELLGVHVPHHHVGVEALGVVPHRMQQVRLAQARAAVDEQRVVRLGGGLRDGRGGGLREAVRGPDHEGVKGVLAVQARILAEGAVRGRRLTAGCRARGGGGDAGEGRHAGVGAGGVGRGAAVVAVGRGAPRAGGGRGTGGAGGGRREGGRGGE